MKPNVTMQPAPRVIIGLQQVIINLEVKGAVTRTLAFVQSLTQ